MVGIRTLGLPLVRGVRIKFHVPTHLGGHFLVVVYILRRATLRYIND